MYKDIMMFRAPVDPLGSHLDRVGHRYRFVLRHFIHITKYTLRGFFLNKNPQI